MAKGLVRNSFKEYLKHFRFSLAFGVLLVFVFFFLLFENVYVTAGTIFAEYTLLSGATAMLALQLLAVVVFLLFYSIFVSFIIFNVRKNLSKVRIDYYLSEKLHRFGFALFAFFLLFTLLLFLFASIAAFFGAPVEGMAAVLFIVSLFFFFVPQSIVVDEAPVLNCIKNGFEFFLHEPASVLKIFALGVALVALLPFIEFAFDFFHFMGRYVSLLLLLVFVLPFIEILKTRAYMGKFGLLKHEV